MYDQTTQLYGSNGLEDFNYSLPTDAYVRAMDFAPSMPEHQFIDPMQCYAYPASIPGSMHCWADGNNDSYSSSPQTAYSCFQYASSSPQSSTEGDFESPETTDLPSLPNHYVVSRTVTSIRCVCGTILTGDRVKNIRSNWKRHIRSKLDNHPCGINYCEKNFNRTDNKKQHIRLCHPQDFAQMWPEDAAREAMKAAGLMPSTSSRKSSVGGRRKR